MNRELSTMPIQFAANWLCRMAAADGVVSARERKLLKDFAQVYGLDAYALIRRAYAITKEFQSAEVEPIDPRAYAGRKFEEFVVSLCSDKKRFKLLAWRGDKISGSTYAQDNMLPDLHLHHQLDERMVEYFVECKYRTVLKDNTLDLTGKLGRYRKASMQNHVELFIALGVGGSSSTPEHFYVIPSRVIRGGHILKLEEYADYLCPRTSEGFHNFISQFYSTRVFRSISPY